MNLEHKCNEIYAFLKTHKPPIPEIGWINISSLLRAELYVDSKTISDSRFEVRYHEARLILEEPWPTELVEGAMYKTVMALYELHSQGTPFATSLEIATRSALAESTVTQHTRKKENASFIVKGTENSYKLLLVPSSKVYIRKPYKEGRLTTLGEEAVIRQERMLLNEQNTVRPIENELSQSIARLTLIETDIAYHRELLRQTCITMKRLRSERIEMASHISDISKKE